MTDRYDAGMRTRRAVLGESHVDRAEAERTEFDEPLQAMITEGVWGTVRVRDTTSRRERSMLIVALLAATGKFKEIQMHVRATARTGASADVFRPEGQLGSAPAEASAFARAAANGRGRN